MRHRPELDGLRGVAIALVVGEHLGVIHAGWAGVSLFFALSGYLITSLLLAERDRTGTVGLGAFYVRRVARLYPALLLAVLVFYVLARIFWPAGDQDLIAGDVIVALFYVGNFVRALRPGPADPVAFSWSLALEEQFYALWPPVLRRVRNLRRAGVVVLCLAAGIAVVRMLSTDPARTMFLFRGDELLLGCALALLGWRLQRLAWVGVAGVVAVLVTPGVIPQPVAITVAAVSSVLVVAGADRFRVLTLRPITYLGRISYGLYAWNGVLTGVYWQRSRGHLPTGWLGVGFVAVEVALAVASTHLLEEPIRRWARQRRTIVLAHPQPVAGH